ncbi:nuclear transport factor 2 family protein [Alcaligenaceae bacterium C4P045]|nr:nuclear transport factor 2 family protein [Alcaligenaceae bacterium C4P045]
MLNMLELRRRLVGGVNVAVRCTKYTDRTFTNNFFGTPHVIQDTAIAVVQKQLDAYNAKDLETLLQTYAPDAEQYALHGELLARGHETLRTRFAARLAEPDLHARLLSRTVMENVVSDFEVVTRNFPEGRGTVEMLCVYEVIDGRIQRASFAVGKPKIETSST